MRPDTAFLAEVRDILREVARAEAEPIEDDYAGDGIGIPRIRKRKDRRAVSKLVELDDGLRAATGHRLGEWHGRAKLPDVEVRAMRVLRVSGPAVFGCRIGYRRLSALFGRGESTIRDIMTGRTRRAT